MPLTQISRIPSITIQALRTIPLVMCYPLSIKILPTELEMLDIAIWRKDLQTCR